MGKKINARAKGARGERELAQFLKTHGINARRGQQFSGSPDSPDVVTSLDEHLHFECKRTESLSVYKAFSQAKDDAGLFKTPIVAHKRNGKEWLAVLSLTDLLTILGYPRIPESTDCP